VTSTASRGTRVMGAFGLASLGVAVVMGLTLPLTAEQQEYSRLIAIHPALAWCAYLAFGVTALGSALYAWKGTRAPLWDQVAAASAEVGVVFTTTALMFVLYLGYLAMRRVPAAPEVRARRSAVVGLLAAVVVPINHFAVEWWRTLHQRSSLAGNHLDGRFYVAMLFGFIAMTLIYVWLLVHRMRVERLEERLEAEGLDIAIAERRAEAEPIAT
jgi:heme exporter protein C